MAPGYWSRFFRAMSASVPVPELVPTVLWKRGVPYTVCQLPFCSTAHDVPCCAKDRIVDNEPRTMRTAAVKPSQNRNGTINAVQKEDLPVHGWYRFVLSFPPHLVREYTMKLNIGDEDLLLDPFCGTGTTLVEAKKSGIPSVGCDAHPFAALVSRVKTNWAVNCTALMGTLGRVLRRAELETSGHRLHALSFDAASLQNRSIPACKR